MRVFLLVCAVFVARVKCAFDCRRLSNCAPGVTCLTDGTCQCAGGFGGDRCALILGTTCTGDPCVNGGTCYVDGTEEKCSCPDGFFGNTCEKKKADVECGGSFIEYKMSFPDTFDGVVKLEDTEALPSVCDFVPTATDGVKTYGLQIRLDAVSDLALFCGSEHVTKAVEATSTNYNRLIRIQYEKTMVTEVDEIANVTCIHRDSDIDKSAEFSSISLEGIKNLTVTDTDDTYDPVGFLILDGSEQPMSPSTELFVGDTFYLHLYLTDTSVFTSLLIQKCVANDTNEVDPKEFVMFDQGCPTKSGKKTSNRQKEKGRTEGTETLPGKAIKVKAFKFIDSSKLGIVCKVKLCADGDLSCAEPSTDDCEAIINNVDQGTGGTETGTGGTGETGGASESGGTGTGGTGGETGGAAGTGEATGTGGAETGAAAGTGEAAGAETGAAAGTGDAAGTETGAATGTGEAAGAETGAAAGTGEAAGAETGAAAGTGEAAGTDAGATGEGAADTGTVRRRRDAGNDGERTVSTVLTVRGPRDYVTDATKGERVESDAESCLASSEVLAILIVLSVVVAILFIACFVLAVCLIRRRQKPYQASANHKSDRFQIPRAHVNDAYREI